MGRNAAIEISDSNSDFAIGYMYWTAAVRGPILETSFTGYRTTGYRRNPTESANGRNQRNRAKEIWSCPHTSR